MTTTDHPAACEPTEIGLDPDALERLVARASREIDSGLLPSCQLAVARHGRLGLFATLGDARSSSRYIIFSCTKALTAGAAWVLIGEGRLHPSTRAAELIPEFAAHGKETVTLEHLLTHTSGFPTAPLGAPDWFTREARLRRFAAWRLNWEPGTRYEYHPTSAHWVIAEMIERAAGVDYRRFFAERVATPLGLPHLQMGVPEPEQHDIATLVQTGEPATPDELEAALGVRELPVTEVTDEALVGFNDPRVRELGVPGGGASTTAADLALYYQALLHDDRGLWDPDVLEQGTLRVRVTLPDPYFAVPANRTLGLVAAGDDGKAHLRGFGRTTSPQAFGHGGAAGQIAWADPATGLSFAYVTNGVDANVLRHARRGVALSSLAAVCAQEAP